MTVTFAGFIIGITAVSYTHLHLENYNDGIRSKDLSDFHSNRASAPVSETSFSLNILYEDTDILAVDKPAGMVTHPTGMHYTDSLSNLVAGYFREKNEQVCVRPVGRLDQETSGIVVFAKNQVAASRLQSVKSPCKIHKQYLAAVSCLLYTSLYFRINSTVGIPSPSFL